MPTLTGADREIDGQCDEKAGDAVDGEKVGLLDGEGGERHQRRGQQPDRDAVQPSPDQVDQEDSPQVEKRRIEAPDNGAPAAGENARPAIPGRQEKRDCRMTGIRRMPFIRLCTTGVQPLGRRAGEE